ncbi:hypothetical protein [Methylocystis sp. ATCC 49242]|uniref:hypothetical protein n=1 Tax=Methylocystis sp. ATCC 49242 TaxID=622637 RepID=UPI0001F873AD|nr:hypothetical protein [Methylocystis sp. ATCC 49242]
MRLRARRFRGPLLIAAFVIGAGAQGALAQELQLDPNALDASGAASVTTKRKGKKAAAPAPQAAGKPGAQQGGPNRQFGELEGWSPGKAPPKTDKDPAPTTAAPPKGSVPVGVSPSGNMSVGLPF